MNALITALIVGLLMHIEGEHYMIANVVAYVVAQIHNFIWCKFMGHRTKRILRIERKEYQTY